MATEHIPVMLYEAMEELSVLRTPNGVFIDATFGGGGHSKAILENLGGGRLVGVDLDPAAAERAAVLSREDARFSFGSGAFDEVLWDMVGEGVAADGILFDLGVSSFQIDEPGRGFSYTHHGPLDMRIDPGQGQSAAEFLNTAGEEEIGRVLRELGDLRPGEARRVAREILHRRPLSTTADLTEAVRGALGWSKRAGNPSRRVFQAVRMHVNDELGSLRRALEASERLLAPGGRLVAITFHSGEDRIVKRFITERLGRCVCPPELPVCVCGARPILRRGAVRRPSERERKENPRSASARLRSAVRTGEPLEAD